MWIDTKDWQRFFSSPLGKAAARVTQPLIQTTLSSIPGPKEHMLAIGYPIAYLKSLSANTQRNIIAMPSYMGAVPWPSESYNQVVLVDETRLPFPDNFFDVIFVTHCLEFSGHQHSFLRELWRVLADQGHLVVLCTHKLSLWSNLGNTPLAQGASLTTSQLSYLLQSNLYTPIGFQQTLFFPPFRWCGQHLSIAKLMNRILGKIIPGSGGILIASAYKQTIIPPHTEATPRWLEWVKSKVKQTKSWV